MKNSTMLTSCFRMFYTYIPRRQMDKLCLANTSCHNQAVIQPSSMSTSLMYARTLINVMTWCKGGAVLFLINHGWTLLPLMCSWWRMCTCNKIQICTRIAQINWIKVKIWHMCKQCVPGLRFPPMQLRRPGEEASVVMRNYFHWYQCRYTFRQPIHERYTKYTAIHLHALFSHWALSGMVLGGMEVDGDSVTLTFRTGTKVDNDSLFPLWISIHLSSAIKQQNN